MRPLTSPLSNSPGGLVRRSWAARTLLGSCWLPDSVGWGGASQHTPDDPGAAARGPDFWDPSFWGQDYGRPPRLPSPSWWSSLSRVPERDLDQCLQISPAGGCEDGLGVTCKYMRPLGKGKGEVKQSPVDSGLSQGSGTGGGAQARISLMGP